MGVLSYFFVLLERCFVLFFVQDGFFRYMSIITLLQFVAYGVRMLFPHRSVGRYD